MASTPNPDRYPYEKRVDEFARIVRDAQRDLVIDVREAIAAGNLDKARRRRLQLAKVLASLDQLGAQIEPEAQLLVKTAFDEAAERTLTRINQLDMAAPEIPGTFTGVSQDAVEALQDSITGRLRTSRQIVGRTVGDVYAQAGREAALRSVLGADDSPRRAARRMAEHLKDVSGFVDTAGKRWALDTYCEMAVRTVTREAVVQGAIARMISHGVNLARVSMHASACDICKPLENRLVSLDGQTTEWEGEAVMDTTRLPPFHPNCRHSLRPVATRIERLRRELEEAAA